MFVEDEIHHGRCFEDLAEEGAVWSDLEFEGCRFVSARLPEAVWTGVNFLECVFLDCDFSNLRIKNSRLRGCEFVDCKLLGVDWTGASLLDSLSFRSCRLDYGNFSHRDLRHGKWLECSAREVHLVGADLSHGDFSGTSFLGSTFSGTNLGHADLREARDYVLDPTRNSLEKTRVSLPEAVGLLRGFDILLEE